jgi:6,7-dimethyl-8-ribityllumazine synthase
MLKSTQRNQEARSGGRFVIVCSRYNSEYTDPMMEAAKEVLLKAGAHCEIVRVPGAFEIPVAAAAVIRRRSPKPDGVLCLGLILRGETNHADHIGESVTRALMELSVESGIPCIHEVLTVQTPQQAVRRCLDPETNRGAEAAHTALDLHRTLTSLSTGNAPSKSAGARRRPKSIHP